MHLRALCHPPAITDYQSGRLFVLPNLPEAGVTGNQGDNLPPPPAVFQLRRLDELQCVIWYTAQKGTSMYIRQSLRKVDLSRRGIRPGAERAFLQCGAISSTPVHRCLGALHHINEGLTRYNAFYQCSVSLYTVKSSSSTKLPQSYLNSAHGLHPV